MAGSATAAETLRFGGTGSATGLLRQIGPDFTAVSGVKIEVVPSLGSTGAIRAVIDGALDVAVSARPLKADEAAAGLQQVAVLRTAFVLATSHRNPGSLKASDLPRIYSTEKSTWADGSPIRIILRPRSETDTALLGGLAAGMDKVIEAARSRAEVPVAATDQDNVELAERTPGSLVTTTQAQLTTENSNLRAIPLDGVEPTLANFESGAYRYAKELYFVRRRNAAAAVAQFVDYLRSPKGAAALRKAETLRGPE